MVSQLRRRGQRAASQSDALLLVDPGIGRGLGEAGDGENDPGCSVKDRARDTPSALAGRT
jgi:hypothetical protein